MFCLLFSGLFSQVLLYLFQIRVLLNIEDTVGPSPVKTRAQAKIAVQEKTVKVSKVRICLTIFV